MGNDKTTKIAKNQAAKVGDKYSYKYVDIAQIHDYLDSINARYIQEIKRIDGDDYIMTKRCFDGKWEDNWLQGCKIVDATLIGIKNPAQEQGSALTYARRYSLLMAFGLATEDDDAQSLSKPKSKLTNDQETKLLLMKKLGYLIEEKGADREKVLEYYGVSSDTEMSIEQLNKAIKDVSNLKNKEA